MQKETLGAYLNLVQHQDIGKMPASVTGATKLGGDADRFMQVD
jgi:hypothetical protein